MSEHKPNTTYCVEHGTTNSLEDPCVECIAYMAHRANEKDYWFRHREQHAFFFAQGIAEKLRGSGVLEDR